MNETSQTQLFHERQISRKTEGYNDVTYVTRPWCTFTWRRMGNTTFKN